MAETITEDEFRQYTPQYVTLAHAMCVLAVGDALKSPRGNIQLNATADLPSADGRTRTVTDPPTLKALWSRRFTQPNNYTFNVDAGLEADRLAMRYRADDKNSSVVAWLYRPFLGFDMPPEPQLNSEPPYNWLDDPARHNPRKQMGIGFFFGWSTLENADMYDAGDPRILAYIHDANTTPDSYMNANTAVLNVHASTIEACETLLPHDAALFESHGVLPLLDRKVRDLLNCMTFVALHKQVELL